MAKLFNLARMTTATTGTGTLTLGAAISGYLTFAQAGVSNGDIIDYAIKDGNNSEHGRGVYTASGTTLTRSVVNSTNSNSAITLSGTAEVFISPLAATLQRAAAVTVFTSSGTFTTPSDSTPDTVYRYRVLAAGGGGGGSNGGSACSGGGGAGAYAEGTFTGVAPSTGITITVGSAGTAGSNTGGNGGGGRSSSIGSPVSITCSGGGGGFGATSGAFQGGAGGTVTGSPNILSLQGQIGTPAYYLNNGIASTSIVAAGAGAHAYGGLGIGGVAAFSGTSGSALTAARGFGAGGSGALSTGAVGSAGAGGIVIIERLSG